MARKKKRIQGWDRKTCSNCERTRTHYKKDNKWYCIGTLQEVLDIVTPCGERLDLETV